jgi:hypothetical protein
MTAIYEFTALSRTVGALMRGLVVVGVPGIGVAPTRRAQRPTGGHS